MLSDAISRRVTDLADIRSHVVSAGRLVGELLLFNTDQGTVHRVVDVWQVGLSGSLSYSTEFIIDGTMAKAHPSLVSTKIWHWNAAQVSANG